MSESEIDFSASDSSEDEKYDPTKENIECDEDSSGEVC